MSSPNWLNWHPWNSVTASLCSEFCILGHRSPPCILQIVERELSKGKRAFQREKVLLITGPQWPHYNGEMIIPQKEDWVLCVCVCFQMRIKWECILAQSESRKIEVRVGEISDTSFLPSFNFCLFIFASNCPVPSTAILTYKMLYKHDIINHTDMLCCRILWRTDNMNCKEPEINLSSGFKRCGREWGWGFVIVAQKLISNCSFYCWFSWRCLFFFNLRFYFFLSELGNVILDSTPKYIYLNI